MAPLTWMSTVMGHDGLDRETWARRAGCPSWSPPGQLLGEPLQKELLDLWEGIDLRLQHSFDLGAGWLGYPQGSDP